MDARVLRYTYRIDMLFFCTRQIYHQICSESAKMNDIKKKQKKRIYIFFIDVIIKFQSTNRTRTVVVLRYFYAFKVLSSFSKNKKCTETKLRTVKFNYRSRKFRIIYNIKFYPGAW